MKRVMLVGRLRRLENGFSECYVSAEVDGRRGTSYEYETPVPMALPEAHRKILTTTRRRLSLATAFRNVHRATRPPKELP